MKRRWGTLERRGAKWFVRYRHEGKRDRIEVGTIEELGPGPIPEMIADQVIAGVRQRIEQRQAGKTFAEFLAEYQDAYAAAVRTITMDNVWPVVTGLAARLGDGPMRSVDYRDAERLLGSLAAAGIKGAKPKPNTLRNYIAILGSFWNAAARYGYVDGNPWSDLKKQRRLPPRSRRSIPILTGDECRRIEGQITAVKRPSIEDAVLRQFVCLLFETGLRRGELLALRRTSVRGELIDIRSAWRPGAGEVQLKTRESMRTLKLTREAQRSLVCIPGRQGVKTSDRIFAGFMRNDTEYRRMQRKLKSACLRAGIAEENVVSFHGCRHVFAVRCVMNGVPLFQLSKILGHAAIQNTMIYADHVPDSFAAQGIDRLEAGEDHDRASRAL